MYLNNEFTDQVFHSLPGLRRLCLLVDTLLITNLTQTQGAHIPSIFWAVNKVWSGKIQYRSIAKNFSKLQITLLYCARLHGTNSISFFLMIFSLLICDWLKRIHNYNEQVSLLP
jgi:hypothetical protein